MTLEREFLRLLDANGNRAAEGLRVLEDIARFILDDARIARMAKELRHAVRAAIPAGAVGARDASDDVGANSHAPGGVTRGRLIDLVRANAARVQEALRVAEEAARLRAHGAVADLESARYRAYQLESAVLSRLPAWLMHRVRLYVIVDTALCADPLAVAVAAARGGAGVVQLRAKGMGERGYRELAARMIAPVRGAGALFIVNDHVAIARALDADGIHVGQDDLDPRDVRDVVGPRCAIGVSAHTCDQALDAVAAGADYLGLGPMHATATKAHEPCRGPELLDQVRDRVSIPTYAIGGLDADRIRTLRPRLLHGVAVASAVCRAADPERAASELHWLLEPEES